MARGRGIALTTAALASLILSSCAQAPSTDPVVGARGVVLAADGLRVPGSSLEIGFQRTEASTITSAGKLLRGGPSAIETLTSCPGGTLRAARWAGGLTLYFSDGDFVGWSSTSPDLATTGGVSVGNVAGPAEAGIRVGTDAAGRVSVLSAGATCGA